jgi:hypothetical protein
MPRVHVPLSNLRAVVILIVVAFHSVLPYLASQPAQPFPFDAPPYRWMAFPIIDRERFFGFDLFCAWQDVSLMTLMFFLAGIFTAPSLGRKGAPAYLSERRWPISRPTSRRRPTRRSQRSPGTGWPCRCGPQAPHGFSGSCSPCPPSQPRCRRSRRNGWNP